MAIEKIEILQINGAESVLTPDGAGMPIALVTEPENGARQDPGAESR